MPVIFDDEEVAPAAAVPKVIFDEELPSPVTPPSLSAEVLPPGSPRVGGRRPLTAFEAGPANAIVQAEQERLASGPPLSKEEIKEALVDLATQGVPIPPFGAEGTFERGVSKTLAGVANFATSPVGIGLAGAAAIPGVGPAITGYFLGDVTKAAAEKAGEASVTGNKEAAGEAATLGLMAGGIARHMQRSAAEHNIPARRLAAEIERSPLEGVPRGTFPPAPFVEPSAMARVQPPSMLEPPPRPSITPLTDRVMAEGDAVLGARAADIARQTVETERIAQTRAEMEAEAARIVESERKVIFDEEIQAKEQEAQGLLTQEVPRADQIQSPVEAVRGETPGTPAPMAEGAPGQLPRTAELQPQAQAAEIPSVGAAASAGSGEFGQGTALKNATGTLERALHGLPDAYPGEVQQMLPAWERSRRALEGDPDVGFRLAEELKHNPERGLTGDESALLLRHKVELENLKNQAAEDTFTARTPEAKAEAEKRFQDASNNLLDLLDTTKFRGSQWGREGRWRQAMAFEDFSLETMRRDKRVALDRELTPAEETQVRQLNERIAELERQLSERETADTTVSRVAAVEESVREIGERIASESKREKAAGVERDLVQERKDAIADLRSRFMEQEGSLEGGNASVRKLMELLWLGGVRERVAMEKAVHDILRREADPTITLEQTQDLMSGYGKFKELSKEPVKVGVRGIVGEIQQVRKLLDFFKGQAPSKTGVERRIPTDKERALQKVVNEAKKRFGTTATDPARSLKSALDAIETRLRNRLADLRQEVATRKRIVKERAPSPYNAETQRLRAEIEKVQKEWDEIFGRPELTPEQRLKIAEESALRQEKELQRQLRTGEVFPKSRLTGRPTSEALEATKARIEALKEEREYARESLQPREEPEAALLRQILNRYRKLEASYKDRLAKGDFAKRERKEQPSSDATIAAKVKLDEAKQAFLKGLHEDRLAKRTTRQKIWDGIKQTARAYTSVISTYDFSAPRQAFGFLMRVPTAALTNPLGTIRITANAFGRMFSAMSEERAKKFEKRRMERPNAKSGADKIAGVDYTDIDSPRFTRHEENARSIIDEWAKLPYATGNLGKTIALAPLRTAAKGAHAHNLAFATFLNEARAGLFDELVRTQFKKRPPTSQELRDIGYLVNLMTGRGELNPKTAEVLGRGMWSPNLFFSRMKLLTGAPFAHPGSLKTKAIVLREYSNMLVGSYLLWKTAQMFNDPPDREVPLTSSDAGKVVRGNVRVDLFAGFQQPVVYGARLYEGTTTSLKGKTSEADLARTTLNFLRSKLRPEAQVALNALFRKDYRGKTTDVRTEEGRANLVEGAIPIPLAWNELIPILKEQGMTEAMILELIALMGGGVSLHEETSKQR